MEPSQNHVFQDMMEILSQTSLQVLGIEAIKLFGVRYWSNQIIGIYFFTRLSNGVYFLVALGKFFFDLLFSLIIKY